MRSNLFKTATVIAIAVFIAYGCEKKTDTDEYSGQDTTAAVTPAPAATPPSDAQIAHIGVTANTIDVSAGKDAKPKAQDTEVKNFAQQMITDHTAANEKASALVQKLNVTPEDNPTSQALNSGAQTAKQQLDAKSGADFDRAYISNEIAFHQQVLDALDNTLIPNTQNAELKAFLNEIRPVVAQHLEHAKQIQNRLGQ